MINKTEITRDIIAELDRLEEKFLDDPRRLKKRILKKQSFNLNAYKRTGLDLAIFRIVNLTNKAKLSDCLYWHIQLGIYHLQREYTVNPSLKIKLDNEVFEIKKATTKSGTSIFDWWNLLNIAIVLRNDEHKNELYKLVDNCREESIDPFWNRAIDLILMCFDKKPFATTILSDLKSIVSSGVVQFHGLEENKLIKSNDSKNIREKMWLPIMELYYLAYLRDDNGFNRLLEEFLLHKKDWILKNKEEDNSNYWVDFPLLACCSYAYDRNITIKVESDYIPSFVYQMFTKNEKI